MVAIAGATAVLTVAADQLTKWWALEALADGPIHVVGPLYLRLTFNSGAAFSMGTGLTPFLTVAVVVLVVVLVSMTRSVAHRPAAIAMGLLLGGATGNLSDRLLRGHDGAVIDWIDFGWWPVFNVADSAVVVGAVLLAIFEARRAQPDPVAGS